MKIELIAECVDVLSRCDVDNPEHQKAISVCESYLMQSYDLYLESCERNGYEPLTQKEYMSELMLNEGFFKKLIKGAAIAGGVAAAGAAAKKTYNAANAYGQANGGQTGVKAMAGNLKGMAQQSGGAMNAVKNVAKTSLNNKVAAQQYQGATKTTTINNGPNGDNSSSTKMNIANAKDAKAAVKNGENLQGSHNIIFQRNGQEKTVDANSERGQRILAGQEKQKQQQQNQNGGQQDNQNGTNPPNNNDQNQNNQNQQKQGFFSRVANGVKSGFNAVKNKFSKNNQNNQNEQQPVQENLESILETLLNAKIINENDYDYAINNVTYDELLDVINEASEPFVASNLKEPLTPAIKMPSKMI